MVTVTNITFSIFVEEFPGTPPAKVTVKWVNAVYWR